MPNQLIHEQSPYLQQHAHNPVDWRPWGDEAFEAATVADKPVIVSIGYAACHWCHVMERESFEDEATAQYMNDHFICIKVDREEHSDIDAMYMDAVQAISGSGGWPLNVFVTPGRVPFYGGTYYPPRPAFNRPSWLQVLQRMEEIWRTQRSEVEAQSGQMLQYLRQVSVAGNQPVVVKREDCEKAAANLLKMADKEWGGFGAAPKFPGTMAITFLLEHHHYFGHEAALEHALLSLDKMIAGGIYDHLGGGFARYSTDREWLAPHFEKMLYDNALLISTLCDALKALGYKPGADQPGTGAHQMQAGRYVEVVRETVAFVNRELRDPSGAFYSALDADSEGEEGKFYTWTIEEWNEAMTGPDPLPAAFFGVVPEGNWEGTNILHEAQRIDQTAAAFNTTEADAQLRIDEAKRHLFDVRAARIRPLTDDKSLLSWNALMNTALTKAGVILGEEAYLRQAADHMGWMMAAFMKEGLLHHVWKEDIARIPAKLDDYAYLMDAMIALGSATGSHRWISMAASLCEEAIALFSEEDSPFFYLSSKNQTDIPVRKADVYDGATPSSNAVMAGILLHLGMLMERSDWSARGEELLSRMCSNASAYTYSFGYWAGLMQRWLAGLKTLVVTGSGAVRVHQALSLLAPPHALVLHTAKAAENIPLTAEKKSDGDSLIFVCTTTACLPAVATPQDALQLL